MYPKSQIGHSQRRKVPSLSAAAAAAAAAATMLFSLFHISTASWSPAAASWMAPVSMPARATARIESLLRLGEGDDPFADEYPKAVCESKKTRVRFCTTMGDCHIVVDRALSPEGVDHFLELVEAKFFDDMLLYRVLPGFLIQFGIHANPEVQSKWNRMRIRDEPNRETFRAGTLSYAGNGQNSRSTHMFIALMPMGAMLGKAAHETTIGHVEDMQVVFEIAANFEKNGYPDLSTMQAQLLKSGNAAAADYPNLDRIVTAEVVPPLTASIFL